MISFEHISDKTSWLIPVSTLKPEIEKKSSNELNVENTKSRKKNYIVF